MADENQGPTILAKMSVKTMGCKPARAKIDDKVVPMAIIVGIARGTTMKMDAKGEPVEALVGDFEGKNIETGELFSSGVCYLPAGIHEQVISGIKKDGATSVQFALQIDAAPSPNKAGYTYTGRPLEKPTGADPLSALRKHLEATPKLAAPKK